jgi:hypothetical protein
VTEGGAAGTESLGKGKKAALSRSGGNLSGIGVIFTYKYVSQVKLGEEEAGARRRIQPNSVAHDAMVGMALPARRSWTSGCAIRLDADDLSARLMPVRVRLSGLSGRLRFHVRRG